MIGMLFILVKVCVIAYVLTDLAQFIGELIDMVVLTKNKWLGVLKSLVVYLLSCSKCYSFWFSLIFTGSLFTAAVAAIIVSQIKTIVKMFDKGDTKI